MGWLYVSVSNLIQFVTFIGGKSGILEKLEFLFSMVKLLKPTVYCQSHILMIILLSRKGGHNLNFM